jgi:cobalt-zinc-cadmium resistance protein CzcA
MSTDVRASRLGGWFAWLLPHRAWVLAVALVWLIVGAASFTTLRRDLFPDLTLPSLSVLIQSPGRAATDLELTVAQPVEQALGGLPGVGRVVSTVQAEVVQIVVTFDADVDPWRARQLVAERLTSVTSGFPEGTGTPLITSAAGRLQEILEIVLEGPAVDPMRLRDYAEKVLVPRLQSVAGVSRIERLGGEERQLQVTLIPERMRLLGARLDDVTRALGGSEQDTSVGVMEIQDKGWFMTVGTLAASPEDVRGLPVETGHGVVTLADLADVREGPAFRRGLARHEGHEDVSLRVVKQPSADTVTVARGVRSALDELRKALPEGMGLDLMYDQGDLVSHALNGVTLALLIGSIFVALVLLTFLGQARAALVVILTLPLATLGAAIPLRILGMGLNAMTLGGLAISVGLLVDASVIMVENLVHRLQGADATGVERRAVLTRAAAEVGVPIVTAVLVILAVFIPLLALGGIAGRLYAPLAVAVASTMTISLIVSFTVVPVLVDRILPAGTDLREPWIVRAVKRAYAPVLTWHMRHGLVVALVAIAITLPSLWLAAHLGTDFLPSLDERALMLNSRLPADTSLEAVDDANRWLEAELSEIDGIRAVYRRTGRSELTEDPMPHVLSDVLAMLDPKADARRVEREVAERIEHLPFSVELTTPMQMRIAEGIGGTPADLQLKLFHEDLGRLDAVLPALQQRIAAVPGVASVALDGGGPLPQWRMTPDDGALRRMGVPRHEVVETLMAALQGLPVGARFDGPQRIGRVVRYPNDGRVSPENLKRLPIVRADGVVVELGQLVRFEESATPSMIRREAGQRRVALNIRTEGDLGGTARRVEDAAASFELPKGTAIRLGGQIEQARATQRRLLAAGAGALVLVVGLLYGALRQWREVLIVLTTLPNAFVGGLLALWLVGETWNISSIVGLIGLFGVAVQNSLVLIRQAEDLRRGGLPFVDAVREASLGRVRPKLMTAGSAILGLAPMLLGIGGSELERPLAIVMVGGLVTSTLYTLLALPSVYAWVGRFWHERAQGA